MPAALFVLRPEWISKKLFPDRLVSGNGSLDGGQSHLGLQAEQTTKVTIQFFVEALVCQAELVIEDVLRYEVAGLT